MTRGDEPISEDDDEDPILNESMGHSEATSQARRDRGLGSSKREENRLIMELQRRNGYDTGKGGLTMRAFEDLADTGDDAATTAILHKVHILGGFGEDDFIISEQAAVLAKRLLRRYRKKRAELTRKGIHKIVVAVLRQCWMDYGPAKVRLSPAIMLEVLELE